MTMQLEFREVRLVDLWRGSRPGEPVPAAVLNLRSWECLLGTRSVGHSTGDSVTGEILGHSVLPAYEGQGIGRRLLSLVVDALRTSGANRIWVAAPFDPALRAYGFYRAVGMRPCRKGPRCQALPEPH